MSSIFSESFDSPSSSPELPSTVIYFITGFCILLVAFLAIIAFSVTVSLTIVSAIHIFTAARVSTSNDPSNSNSHSDLESSGAHRRTHQVLEALNRVIRERGRAAAGAEAARLEAALQKLPPPEEFFSGDGSQGGAKECVICLEEFRVEEMCQVFPACQHVFHSECIGNWLKTNSTCPLCRTCILDPQPSDQKS